MKIILNKIILSILIISIICFFPLAIFAEDSSAPGDLMFRTMLHSLPFIGLPLALSGINSTNAIDLIGAPVKVIAGAVLTAGLWAVQAIINSALMAANGLLEMTLNAMFEMGFTPSDNSYIAAGWMIVKNLANAVLVLGLVAIAISIILGRDENKAKKLLINFILIALLINFTPVICGFIIDGSNIITKSMLTGGINTSYSEAIVSLFSKITNFCTSGGDVVVALSLTFTIALFALITIVIYFLYAILFLARTVILWILVIVSPIAFASFIIKDLPQSKYISKIFPSILSWDAWWESFIQWCVIGIPAGMSIYLANKMLVAIGEITTSQVTAVTITADLGPILAILFSYAIPFVFLLVGFFITISTGTESAKKLSPELTSFGKKGLSAIGAAGSSFAGGAIGAGAGVIAGANNWRKRDSIKDSNNIRDYLEFGAREGWKQGESAVKTDGAIGATLNASNRAIGAGTGAMIKGPTKWTLRKLQDPKDKSSLKDSILDEAKTGYNEGGVKVLSGIGGTVVGGTVGLVEGANLGLIEGLASSNNLEDSILKGAKDGMKIGAKTGKNIASELGVHTAHATKRGVKEITDTMINKVQEMPK